MLKTSSNIGNFANFSINGNIIVSSTPPTIGAGFGTGPTILANNTAAFKVTVGTGGAPTGTLTFSAAPNGWVVYAQDVTSGTTIFLQQTASSSTSATVTSFSITTGLAANMAAGDVILCVAMPY